MLTKEKGIKIDYYPNFLICALNHCSLNNLVRLFLCFPFVSSLKRIPYPTVTLFSKSQKFDLTFCTEKTHPQI